MRSRRVTHIKDYLLPTAAGWHGVTADNIPMIATPLSMQPTEYIQKSWEGRPYGDMNSISVASVHDGHTWAVRATWTGVAPAGKDFPDALAVAMPVSGSPVLALMGAPETPIHILRWQAGKDEVRSVLASGIGQSRPGADIKCGAQAKAESDVWSIVVTRPLGTGKDVAPLAVGKKTGVGFAVWHGGNDERAGIKAFSIDWTELVLDI